MSRNADRLRPELRAVEVVIDNLYRGSPLMRVPFSEAAWNLFFTAETDFAPPAALPARFHTLAMLTIVKYELKCCLSWLRESCPPGGRLPPRFNGDILRWALDLRAFSRMYTSFVAAFTLGSRGLIDLQLEGHAFKYTSPSEINIQYEAYDALLPAVDTTRAMTRFVPELASQLGQAVRSNLHVHGDKFRVHLRPRLIELAVATFHPIWDGAFSLPGEWAFTSYTLSEFRRVFEVLAAIAGLHGMARWAASDRGCPNSGFASVLYKTDRHGLVDLVRQHCGCSEHIVNAVVHDLTYGSHALALPDPALQPIIPMRGNALVIPSVLIVSSAPERNLLALFNRLPREQRIYSTLVAQKEELMRTRIVGELARLGQSWRHRWGHAGGARDLPDVDLAIIDDSERICLLMELKWFIDPAEPREVAEKSEEINKGIAQVRTLMEATQEPYQPLLDLLNIDESYRVAAAVVSANATCGPFLIAHDIPVIRESHFCLKMSHEPDLGKLVTWLQLNAHLPVHGRDFRIIAMPAQILDWHLEWYGFDITSNEDFAPI